VYVFFAGHGVEYRNQLYFLPYEADRDHPDVDGIPMDVFFRKATRDLLAKQVVVFIDACHAAGAEQGRSPLSVDIQKQWDSLNQKEGPFSMALFSSLAYQKSWEDPQLGGGHGLFTWYVLEGLKGAAAASSEGYITANSLLSYARDKVEARSRARFPAAQTPSASPEFRGDFVLGYTEPSPATQNRSSPSTPTPQPVSGPCGPVRASSPATAPMGGGAADFATATVTRGSSISGSTYRDFVTSGKGTYEVSMGMQPNWQPEALVFRFSPSTSIVIDRSDSFPRGLVVSGYPLTINRLTKGGFEVDDNGCAGIEYEVTWRRGSEITEVREDKPGLAAAEVTHTIPVENGRATPDLTRGSIQLATLVADTTIDPPIVPPMSPGTVFRWTLFLDQDTVGGHAYTILFLPDLTPLKGLLPHTRARLELATDEKGITAMLSPPMVNRPITVPLTLVPNPSSVGAAEVGGSGQFVTESYRLTASTGQRSTYQFGTQDVTGTALGPTYYGSRSMIALAVTIESSSKDSFRFVIRRRSCYLSDENGNIWTQSDSAGGFYPDSAGMSSGGIDLIRGVAVKSVLSFVARGETSGTRFALVCSEESPKQGRTVIVHGITSR
jgi:hypothetical protein